MFGDNPKRKAINDDGAILQVQSIFATFQGEGPYAGYPSVFIRLGGCNLACSFCDTEFETFSTIELNHIIEEVEKLSGNRRKLVVITGGEPMRQNIIPLCEKLLSLGYQVQIETNGTIFRPLPNEVSIICSPKATAKKYNNIHPELLERITALKFIIAADLPIYNDVPELGQQTHQLPVYVQPMDQYDPIKNQANIKHALAIANKYGYRISLQIHKILNIE